MQKIPDDLFGNTRGAVEAIQKLTSSAHLANEIATSYTRQLQDIAETFSRSFDPILVSVRRTAEWLGRLDKAGLTPNLGESRSTKKLKDYQRLLRMGYAIFWVPRAEIVDKLLSAGTVKEHKEIILSHKAEILEDCQNVIENIDKKYLKDHVSHLFSAIDSMSRNDYRAAQSTANVCFDALFDHIIDSSSLNRFGEIAPTIETSAKKLRKYKKLPAKFLYAALQAELIVTTIRKFNRLKPDTVLTKYGRHSSAHSVSARQFNEHNALQSIMTATSILATTNKLGASWMTNLSGLV